MSRRCLAVPTLMPMPSGIGALELLAAKAESPASEESRKAEGDARGKTPDELMRVLHQGKIVRASPAMSAGGRGDVGVAAGPRQGRADPVSFAPSDE
jgi:hypothetical protein